MTAAPPTSATLPSGLLPARIVTNPWVVLSTLTFGYFLVVLYTAIVFTASAAIETGLHASFDQLLWILNGFALVFAILLIPGGRLADMFGAKRMFIIGLVWFTLATGACGFARDATVLIAFRLLQGVGAALLTTQTLSYINRLFPPSKRGAAIGVWGGITAVSGALGPTIGGLLVSGFGWQSIFFISLPLGIIAVIAALLFVPEVASARRHSLDPFGVLLLAGGLFSGLYAFIEAQRFDWGPISGVGRFTVGPTVWSVLSIYSCLLYAVVLLGIWVWREHRVAEPMLPIKLFADRNFSLGSTVMVVLTFSLIGMFAPLILFLETILGFSAVKAGLILLPSGLIPVVVAPLSGRLTERFNGKYVLAAGLLASACGFALLIHTVALDNTPSSFLISFVVQGVGFGLSFASVMTLAMRDVSPTMAGGGSGYINASRQAAGSVGGAIMGTVLAHGVTANLGHEAHAVASQLPAAYRPRFLAGFAHQSANLGAQTTSATVYRPGVPHAVIDQMVVLGQHVANLAFLDAMRPTMAVPVVLSVLGACGALLMRGSERRAAVAGSVETSEPTEVRAVERSG